MNTGTRITLKVKHTDSAMHTTNIFTNDWGLTADDMAQLMFRLMCGAGYDKSNVLDAFQHVVDENTAKEELTGRIINDTEPKDESPYARYEGTMARLQEQGWVTTPTGE